MTHTMAHTNSYKHGKWKIKVTTKYTAYDSISMKCARCYSFFKQKVNYTWPGTAVEGTGKFWEWLMTHELPLG